MGSSDDESMVSAQYGKGRCKRWCYRYGMACSTGKSQQVGCYLGRAAGVLEVDLGAGGISLYRTLTTWLACRDNDTSWRRLNQQPSKTE